MYTKHIILYILVALVGLFFPSCRNNSKSNVPDYPVNIRVEFPLEYKGKQIAPYELCTSMVIDKKRYESDIIGYSGIVIWCNIHSEYQAADLCCPKCLLRYVPVEVNGMDAACPTCGEHFNLTEYGFPTQRIADQPLKNYGVTCTPSFLGVIVTVRN